MCEACVDLIRAVLEPPRERLPRGFRESWARQHLPNTLDALRDGVRSSYPLLAILRRAERDRT